MELVLHNPNQIQADAITVTYPDSVTEVYKYRNGGTSGNVVLVLTLVYADSTKVLLTSVVRG